jgi:DNA-binding MarR family transcriptional regulator
MAKTRSAKPSTRRPSVTTVSFDTKRKIVVGSGNPELFEGLDRDPAQAWRHNTLGRLLLFSFHAFEARLLESYHAAGFSDVRQAHLNALRHLDLNTGTRIIDLAARAGVTKGAMGKIVVDCEQLGLVELRSDPAGGRAKIVSYSKKGRALVEVTRRAARRIEADFAKLIGAADYEELRGHLVTLRQKILHLPRS